MTKHFELPRRVDGPVREFHVSRVARDTYGFSDRVFSIQGHTVFADVRAARDFAYRINTARDTVNHPNAAVSSGDLYAMGLIDEILHYVIALYREQFGPQIFSELRAHLSGRLGREQFEYTLKRFSELFPTVAHYRGKETVDQTLDRSIDGIDGRDIAIEEMILLWLGNRNPAYRTAGELFDEDELEAETQYGQLTDTIVEFFTHKPPFGLENLPLIELLRQPALRHPHSLQAQLEYIRTGWGNMLGSFLDRLLRGEDLMAEEQRSRLPGPGPTPVIQFGSASGFPADDKARFSPDKDWMPTVVLLAKSTLVWLSQMSRAYGRDIRTLDAIPDEELDGIASRGFTGLWLIGLWQRSRASRRIKQITGNPDAEASAYSLYDYDIADELGGWAAVENLRHRLWLRGVRLASDMVPNHVGIDGKWLYEHPDWFVQLSHPPFPGYSFGGENLSGRDDIGIFLEDHYYDRTDAAVVFRRVDFHNGDERFIYHGNDGTTMPWNDTAQLNYLNAEAREAVIQTILHVARNFPIIRFDAAMTLAKKHIQRLWFPAPGQGGDIPSRSEHGIPQEAFDEAIPLEFWREVVDRVSSEVPDTLLLAEAFWMMEGYFVRTLGMHRVYNSAFMNMLKSEENGKYRETVKNTLEYDPEILKRFVNFMNNPDEETAVAQFGRDDKYFGVATLMVTMPGLPMFGHGQVEGFTEKYGMEYRRAYLDETPDQHLISRHEREIFPLMHKRYLFAESAHFRLYDFYDTGGTINENVFAYTNRSGNERAFVLFNNSYYQTAGWIQSCVPFAVFHGEENRDLRTQRLGEALGLRRDYNCYLIFREQQSNLWYIRNCGEIHERGLYAELRGYQSQVFLDMYEVTDTEHSHYARLKDNLNGNGTPDIARALKKLMLQPLHDAFAVVANTGTLRRMQTSLFSKTLPGKSDVEDWTTVAAEYESFLEIAARFTGSNTRIAPAVEKFTRLATGLSRLSLLPAEKSQAARTLKAHLSGQGEDYSILLALLLLLPLDQCVIADSDDQPHNQGFHALDRTGEWLLINELHRVFEKIHPDNPLPAEWDALLETLLVHHQWPLYGKTSYEVMERILKDDNSRRFLGVHEYNGVVWFNREAFEEVRDWLFVIGLWHEATTDGLTAANRDRIYNHYKEMCDAEKASGYRLPVFLTALKKPARKKKSDAPKV